MLSSALDFDRSGTAEEGVPMHTHCMYSGCHWKVYECCFMKQNCHFQRGLLQYKNATTPLNSSAIHTTHQHFWKRYITLFSLRGLKSYQPSKFESVYFLSKTGLTFLLWLITFEPLEQKQSYIPLLKVLMCGMNAWGAQWHGGIFILQFTSLKMVLLLHKTALVNFPMATTVFFKFRF